MQDHYKENLFDLCRNLLGYPDVNWDTHTGIISALESETKRKLVVLPRGSLKSSIGIVGYSIWSLIRNPNLRILIDSEVYTNSKNFLREISQHMQAPALTRLFGEFKSASNWTEGEITIRQRTKNLKEASITCGGVGTVKVGQHYDLILCDDLNSTKNSINPDMCEKVRNHYRMNISILEPEGTLVVIATRYSELDVVQMILDQEIFPQETGLL